MKIPQFTLIAASLIAILAMYQLPKVVVKKQEDKEKVKQANKPPATKPQGEHQAMHLTESQHKKLLAWKKELADAATIEKKRIFADSIALIFKQVNRLDSAAVYYSQALQDSKETKDKRLIADTWFEAFRFALSVDADRANQYGEQARTLYGQLLEQNPKLYAVKANLAMTYVATQSPMKGIALLREILAEDPKNELALFDMGLLAIQSGQFDKAVTRFESLLEVNPNHMEAKLHLAECLLNTQNKARAKKILTEITQLKADSLAIFRQIAKETLEKIQ